MTYQSDFTLPNELLEQIATQGFDVLPELIRIGNYSGYWRSDYGKRRRNKRLTGNCHLQGI